MQILRFHVPQNRSMAVCVVPFDGRGGAITITQLTGSEDCRVFREIEGLHRAQLAVGALAQMPQGFLASFYRFLAGEPESVLITAGRDGRFAGFCRRHAACERAAETVRIRETTLGGRPWNQVIV